MTSQLSFPEDYTSEESHEHFWNRTVEVAAEWLEQDIEVREIHDLETLIPDWNKFMEWLWLYEQDVHDFIEFQKSIELNSGNNYYNENV